MNLTIHRTRMCALIAGLSLAGFMYLLPGVAVADPGARVERATPDMFATSDPGILAHNHLGYKGSVASVRNTPERDSAFSALLPPGVTPRVPEPGTLGLLAIGATFLLRRRRR